MFKIAISGKLGTGKTTAVEFLKNEIQGQLDSYESVQLLKFADPLYRICEFIQKTAGWPIEKDGDLLQKVGTDIMRTKNPNVWVEVFDKTIKELPEYAGAVLVDDCRFPNELEYLKNNGFVTIRLKRNSLDAETANLGNRKKDHPSETALDGMEDLFDFVYENKDLEDFKSFLRSVIKL